MAIVGLPVRDVCVAEYLAGLVSFVGCGLWVVAECSVSEQQRSRLAGVCVISWFLKSRPQFVLKIVFASKRQKQ